MRRQDGRRPVKSRRRRTVRAKPRTALSRRTSAADWQELLDRRTRERDEALQQQAATAEALNVISRSSFDLQIVLDKLTQTAAQLCNADMAGITRERDGAYYYASVYNYPPELHEFIRSARHERTRGSVTGRVLLDRKTIHVSDVTRDAEYTMREFAQKAGFRTALGVPLLRAGNAIGVIILTRSKILPFTDKQIDLVTTFADQAVIAIENARLFNELQQSLQQQTATADVLKVISRSTFDLQTVLDTLVESAARLCAADMANLLRPKGEVFQFAASYGHEWKYREHMEIHAIPVGRGSVAGRTLLESKTVQIPDVFADPEYKLTESAKIAGFRTTLGVPLLREGTPIGVITLQRRTVQPFTDKQIELVTTFADQAVIAIENVRLFEAEQQRSRELSQSLEQQTATADVLRVISSSPTNAQPVFDMIAQSAARLCKAQFCHVFRFDGELIHFEAVHGYAPEVAAVSRAMYPMAPGRGSAAARSILSGSVEEISDILADHDYEHGEQAKRMNYRSIVAVPMLKHDRPIGAIAIAQSQTGHFPAWQIELLRTFADQAVIAIENARLFEEVQARTKELTKSVEELRALGEVGQAINSTLDVEAVLARIVARAVQLSGTEAGTIYTFDESRREFQLRATHGMDEGMIAAIRDRSIGAGQTAIGKAAAERAPFQIPDVLKEQSLVLDVIVRAGYRSMLVVPLLRPDQIVGALVVRRKAPGEFPKSTIELLRTFADQSVLAIQNARLFREIEQKSRELEQASQHKSQFLANMSHELRTPLNAILGYTELMADGAYGEPSEKMLGVLQRLEANGKHLLGLINDVLDLSKIEAGQLVLELSDYSIQDIAQTVRSTLEPLAADKKLAFKVEVAAQLPSGRGDGRRLTQVLINLVGNAIKFTDAGEVAIKAEANNGSFYVSVGDTGPGISAADQARLFQEFQQADNAITKKKGGTGLGLAISKRIIEMHGGRIWVESQPGQGSTFAFALPVIVERQAEPA
jgi:signal transduction histidine kinase